MSEKYRAFTQKYNGRAREIHTSIKVSLPLGGDLPSETDSRLVSCVALWDTGATNSCVTASMAGKLGLKAVTFTESHHAGGISQVPVYIIDMYLTNKVRMPGIMVTGIADTVGGFDILIGMDVITMGDFSLTNLGGNSCVSFRIPSFRQVDFVEDHAKDSMSIQQSLKSTRPQGQNESCNCGSGKKYKHCHGKK